jgi:hypothetical protein
VSTRELGGAAFEAEFVEGKKESRTTENESRRQARDEKEGVDGCLDANLKELVGSGTFHAWTERSPYNGQTASGGFERVERFRLGDCVPCKVGSR